MASPLTPKHQYEHVTETRIAFSTCSTSSALTVASFPGVTTVVSLVPDVSVIHVPIPVPVRTATLP